MKLKNIWNYSQPDFYHFSKDSVELAKFAAKFIANIGVVKDDFIGLDLCCGCGVVGLEFLSQFNQDLPFDFCEVQSTFQSHFLSNRKKMRLQNSKYLDCNFMQLPPRKYDLILSNPPFFNQKRGRLSANQAKNRCRFFIDNNFQQLVKMIYRSLKPNGHAFFLVRDESLLQKSSPIPIEIVEKITGAARICSLGSL